MMITHRFCPIHKADLDRRSTQYGNRWQCPVAGCTVACWDGSTSTPADQETRKARNECHELFDPLWKTRSRFKSRRKAYQWLQRVMELPESKAHIGMFDLEQCRFLLGQLQTATVEVTS